MRKKEKNGSVDQERAKEGYVAVIRARGWQEGRPISRDDGDVDKSRKVRLTRETSQMGWDEIRRE